MTKPMHEFWKSSGRHLLAQGENNWLKVTPDFLRAYLARPEMHPVEESCADEVTLFERLMDDPFGEVSAETLAGLADPDAADNYKAVLAFRDALAAAGTVEGAYLALMRGGSITIPPVFLDQLVHVILRQALDGVGDPVRLRAAEIFFREQNVNTDDGRLMLADEEVVEMHAQSGGAGGLGQLLVESGTAMKSIELDVLDEDNAAIYWDRSDRFDTVVDFRFGQPALDAFARVLEAWVKHLTGHTVRVQPRKQIDDDDWRWHIGLDRDGTDILNRLYEGADVPLDDIARILGLFQMTFADETALQPNVRGRPIYLALAMTPAKRVKMKPQNLIVNLPLVEGS
ncbi:MAG: DUF6352 family protein [Hyphomicrobiaceae bacterium]